MARNSSAFKRMWSKVEEADFDALDRSRVAGIIFVAFFFIFICRGGLKTNGGKKGNSGTRL